MFYSSYAERVTKENRALKSRIEMLEASDAVRHLKEEYEKIIRAQKDRIAQANQGWENCVKSNRDLKYRNSELLKENSALQRDRKKAEKELEHASRELISTREKLSKAEVRQEKYQERQAQDAEKISSLKKEIEALKDEIARLRSEKDHDGTTSGIPTSRTPIDKQKRNPVNSREETEKNKGGQPGHSKHEKKALQEEEITEEETHEESVCPECGGELEILEELPPRDEVDYEVRIIKRRHHFYRYVCKNCGRIVESEVPLHLKTKSQYGVSAQAMILMLLDLGFVSTERTRVILQGLMGKENLPSIGYVGKIQKKAARMLTGFRDDIREQCLKEKLLHWDDTVVFMNTKRGCLRFYGNRKLALYYAHSAKDAKGLEKDGILDHLTGATTLMHDHLTYNYRKEFLFRNIECIQHLERDLQKNSNDSGHSWSTEAKELIQRMIHRRKEYRKAGKTEFSSAETNEFENELVRILTKAKEQSQGDPGRYYYKNEQALIRRIENYTENYFAWVYDFELPTTNNLAESSLRMIKTKMKVSGQFLNEKTADEFALVRTYIETCNRNGKDLFKALQRLMRGKPYTLQEVLCE